jgi:hypothetical protein
MYASNIRIPNHLHTLTYSMVQQPFEEAWSRSNESFFTLFNLITFIIYFLLEVDY